MLKRDSVLSTHTFGREKINADIALYMTLWYLLNTVTFRQISDRFGVPKSSARRIITKVINYLVKTSKNYIIWFNKSTHKQSSQIFKKRTGMNGIIGSIDGCHIQINTCTCVF